MSEPTGNPSLRLDYAAPARSLSRRRAWRLVLSVGVVFTAWLACDKWGQRVRLQWDLCHSQSRCMRFSLPPDCVAYDNDFARAAVLRGGGGYRPGRTGDLFNALRSSSVPGSAALTRADEVAETFAGARTRVASAEARRQPSPPYGIPSSPVFDELDWSGDSVCIFLHERIAAPSRPRLVEIRAKVQSDGSVGFGVSLWSPASWTGNAEVLENRVVLLPDPTGTPSWRIGSAGGVPIRVFFGQPDLADTSRFWIHYETSAGRGTVEGRLTPDDRIELRVVSGPTTQVGLEY